MDIFEDILRSLDNPQMRHAMIVHMPIALSLIGVPLVLISALFPKLKSFRWLALIAYVGLAASAYMASQSGMDAEGRVNPAISMAGDEALHEHKVMGNWVWKFGAGCVLLICLTFLHKPLWRNVAASLVVLGSLAIAGWVAVVGHYGGTLVYEHHALGDGSQGVGDSTGSNDPRLVFFRTQVEPIFRDRCWGCHNPSRMHRSGDLNLTDIKSILQGGESAPADPTLVPGDVERSLIVAVVRYTDFIQMPPEKEGGKLSDTQIAAIERWVLEGAVWPEDLVVPASTPDERGVEDTDEN